MTDDSCTSSGQPRQSAGRAGIVRLRIRNGRSPHHLVGGRRGAEGVMTWPGSLLPKSRIFVGTADSFAVQVFDLRARPEGTLRWSAQPRRFTDEDKAAYAGRAARSLASATQQQRMREGVTAMQFPEFLPPYDRLLVDDAERLGVQQADAPTHRRRRWWGFDVMGTMVATLDVPGAFLLQQLSGNDALGTWTDDDGVQSVRSSSVVRPRG